MAADIEAHLYEWFGGYNADYRAQFKLLSQCLADGECVGSVWTRSARLRIVSTRCVLYTSGASQLVIFLCFEIQQEEGTIYESA